MNVQLALFQGKTVLTPVRISAGSARDNRHPSIPPRPRILCAKHEGQLASSLFSAAQAYIVRYIHLINQIQVFQWRGPPEEPFFL